MLLFAAILVAITPGSFANDKVVVCPITGMIDQGVAVLVARAVKEAREMDASAIIFTVDTPGGRVDSAVEIAKSIGGASCRTIAYIEGMGAISAGALISFSCDDLIMTSSSNIGAATPVIPTAQGMTPTGEKEVSFMRAKMRALAESGNHNPDIAQAMVDKDIELRGYLDEQDVYVVYAVDSTAPGKGAKSLTPDARPKSPLEEILKKVTGGMPVKVPQIDGPVETEGAEQGQALDASDSARGTVVFEDGSELVLPRGKLLTLTPKESLKYGVIGGMADNLDEVVEYYDLGEVEFIKIVPNWAEIVFRWLTNPTVAGLLMMLAMGGLYFEVKTPGFGVPGLIGVVCLALFFGSHIVLGLTDVIDVILVATGVALLLVEMFLLPGFGIAGAAGLMCLMVGAYLSLVNFTIPEYSWQFEQLWNAAYSLGIACLTFLLFVFTTYKLLPRTPLYAKLIMTGTQQVTEGYVVQTSEEEESAIGLEGTATSMLRPTGRGRFGEQTYQVVSRGDYIEKGAAIVIIEAEGNRYVVGRRQGESVDG